MAETLNFQQLQELTGYERPSDIMRNLEKQGIAYFVGKDGPYTTVELLRIAAVSGKTVGPEQKIEFD